MPNRDLALEAYPPHFMSFWRAAALQRVEVEMTYREAVSTRAALYRMRAKMRDEKHPSYDILSKVILQIDDPIGKDGTRDRPVKLIGNPLHPITNAFEAAGIMPDLELDEDPLSGFGEEQGP